MSENKNQQFAFAGKRRVSRIGGSRMVALPAEWCEQHGVKDGDDLSFAANRDLKFFAPEGHDPFYKKVTQIVKTEE